MAGPPVLTQSIKGSPVPAFLGGRSDSNSAIAGATGVVVVSLVALTLISRWMIRICRPHEMLVVTGSRSIRGNRA